MASRILPLLASTAALVEAVNPSLKLKTYPDVLDLAWSFDPLKASYWTGLPHHRRIPFAVSPDGQTGYLVYLDSSGMDVHGPDVTIPKVYEAGGIVAHDHGFALLGNEPIPSTTSSDPPSGTDYSSGTPVPAIYRYANGNGNGRPSSRVLVSTLMTLYGAYFVVTDYEGWAAGHFGDIIEYVNDNSTLETITGAFNSWGCSHNTGIAFEAADQPPYASICAEDQGAIRLNTKGTGMENTGVKIPNENTTTGGSGEPMGGMSGSYSGLAKFINSTSYIFTWVSRGAIDLTENTWMGEGYTHSVNRTNGRRVAMTMFSDKEIKVGAQATSEVGATDGDSQVTWITPAIGPDRSNAHVAVFDDEYALITYEETAEPSCDFIAMGYSGTFSGTYYQLVNTAGTKIRDPIESTNTYVANDMVTLNNGTIFWPYVNMEWQLNTAVGRYGGVADTTTKKMSFACMSLT